MFSYVRSGIYELQRVTERWRSNNYTATAGQITVCKTVHETKSLYGISGLSSAIIIKTDT